MPALTRERTLPDASPPMSADAPVRVLIVDDSIVARAVIARTIEAEPDLEVVAQAGTTRAALELLGDCAVDAIILDLEMPGGGGLEALPALIEASGHALVLIVSSAAAAGADATVTALRLGAADTLLKPKVGFGKTFADALVDRLRRLGSRTTPASPAPPVAPIARPATVASEIRCVAIGASTGGVHALAAFFGAYPQALDAPILVTQHLPAPFMTHFARQLGEMARRPVTIAEDGVPLRAGAILLAPGDASISLLRTRGLVHVKLDRRRAASGCLPSVDPMFDAVAKIYGEGATGVVLSGMGRDGLAGARTVRAIGGTILAQDAASSVVWGMPGAVVQAGLATGVMPPEQLAQRIRAMAAGRMERR